METACVGYFVGFISCLIAMLTGRTCDDGDNQESLERDSDVKLYIPVRNRNRCSHKRNNQHDECEEMITVLDTLRLSCSPYEKKMIDKIKARIREGENCEI